MPIGNSVYQPTTVSYENRPGSLLSQTTASSPLQLLRKPIPQIIILLFGIFSVALGSAMIINAGTDYNEAEKHKGDIPIRETENTEAIDIGLIVGGILITIFGFILLGFYLKFAEWRRTCVCPCGLSKKQGLARQLQGGNGGAQILPLNPSTDPLVSHTQYAPVSELPRPEDEECRTLMNDNKDCLSSAEESDRMLLDPDPRIVLRPVGHVEEA